VLAACSANQRGTPVCSCPCCVLQANLSENINKGYMESVKHLRDMLMAYEWDLHGKELAGRK
jgi:hypothetical protein